MIYWLTLNLKGKKLLTFLSACYIDIQIIYIFFNCDYLSWLEMLSFWMPPKHSIGTCLGYTPQYLSYVSHSMLPAYSVKQIVSGDRRIFSSKRSFLFKKRMIEVSPNHLLLQMESNSFKLSCILFVVSSSWSTWSYSDMATQKIMAVTSSKQWIHFFLSDRWPPTSNSLKLRFLNEKWTSTIPVVLTLVRRMSCSVGW